MSPPMSSATPSASLNPTPPSSGFDAPAATAASFTLPPFSAPTATALDLGQLDRICTAIRGKLQFMDYLVRAAVADVERFQAEGDAGTRIFLRQLVEMHAHNLAQECENMRVVGELCAALQAGLDAVPTSSDPLGPGQGATA